MNSDSIEKYEVSGFDLDLIAAAISLLNKMTFADALTSAQLVTVAKVQHAFSRIPRTTTVLNARIQITGPRCQFGDIETYHWWTLAIEGHRISIDGGGHFYRPSSGGDSFTTMVWAVEPSGQAEFKDYIDGLGIVPDVKSFPDAVHSMNFSSHSFDVEVTDSDNALLDEDEDEEDEEEEEEEAPPLQMKPVDSIGQNLAKQVVQSDVNLREPEYAYGIKSCDLCRCNLAEQGLFVDGSLRNDSQWANMCPQCFEKSGAGVGWGKGQLYAIQSDGKWRMVSGFAPN